MSFDGVATPPNEFRDKYRIVVIGAGLVGLLLAIVLRQAGYSVVVVDKDNELKEIGAGIILPANACRALDQAGVLKRIQSCAVAPKEWVSYSYQKGTVLGCLELLPYIQERYKTSFLVIHRPDLRRILFEEAKAWGASIRLNTTVDMQYADLKNGVIYLRSSSNNSKTANRIDDVAQKEALPADLVIASDGQQSETRAFLSGQPNQSIPTGKMVNRIVMGVDQMRELGLNDLVDPPRIHVWLGPKSLAVGYLLKDVFNFALTCSSEKEPDVFIGPREVEKDELRAVFQDWDPRIRLLVENGHGFLKWLLLDNSHHEVPSWIRAVDGEALNVALTGDAAHAIGPFIGSGAALGFESATVLGNLLAEATHQSEVPRILKMYERLRRPRTDLVRGVTQKMADVWMLPNGPLQVARDRVFLEECPPSQGYPNALQDPFFQTWLYSFDGKQEARRAWCNKGGI
ncbi:MAG: hypothetical protein Q9219_004956 [cf. Caloplaca sp. 3 TL-2023]